METHSSTTIGRGLRLITLSRFAGNRANAMRQQRIREYDEQSEEHHARLEIACRARDLAMSDAKRSLSSLDLMRAWRSWRISRLVEKEIVRIKSRIPTIRSASIEEQQARAGDEAERRLDEFLATALGKSWTMIAGYHGRTGEIDRILIGPWGIYAFEIKGNRGVIHSGGARWWVERFDRRGNPLGMKALPRAPDAQLTKATDGLEGWLRRNGIDLGVERVILFAADDARIGTILATNAVYVTTLRDLDLGRLFNPSARSDALAPYVCERIVNLIGRDHAFWEQKRSESQSRSQTDSFAVGQPTFLLNSLTRSSRSVTRFAS